MVGDAAGLSGVPKGVSPKSLASTLGLAAVAAVALAGIGGMQGVSAKAVGPQDPQNPTPGLTLTTHGPAVKDRLVLTDAEWKKRLTPDQYSILRTEGTEPAFCSPLLNVHKAGVFECAACGNPLFRTNAKFDSHTGWPSFFQPASKDAVWYRLDGSLGDARTEVRCSRCDSHLGHVFDDGPADKGGRRYCMNGLALKFVPDKK